MWHDKVQILITSVITSQSKILRFLALSYTLIINVPNRKSMYDLKPFFSVTNPIPKSVSKPNRWSSLKFGHKIILRNASIWFLQVEDLNMHTLLTNSLRNNKKKHTMGCLRPYPARGQFAPGYTGRKILL